jgi:hypothetical protein
MSELSLLSKAFVVAVALVKHRAKKAGVTEELTPELIAADINRRYDRLVAADTRKRAKAAKEGK